VANRTRSRGQRLSYNVDGPLDARPAGFDAAAVRARVDLGGDGGTHRAAASIACATWMAWERVSTVAVFIVASNVTTTRR
jgi:hypothetical protein